MDDLLIIADTSEKVQGIKERLMEIFKVHDLGKVKSFLGCEVRREEGTGKVHMSNVQKIEELAKSFNFTEGEKVFSTPMCKSFVATELPQSSSAEEAEAGGSGALLPDGNRYSELVGSLQYLANTTRPDISQAVGCFG